MPELAPGFQSLPPEFHRVTALAQGRGLDARYKRWRAAWEVLGYPAFTAMLAVFFLMVNKPQF